MGQKGKEGKESERKGGISLGGGGKNYGKEEEGGICRVCLHCLDSLVVVVSSQCFDV